MTPWSISWRMDVVFGGKNTIWTLVKFEIDGWDGQMSMIRAIFRSSARNFRSSLQTHSSKISLFIQLIFCDLYSHGRCLTFLKAAGIFRFLDHKHGQFFSLAAAIPVSLTLFFYPGTLFSFEVICFIWETLIEKTELVCIENIFQLIVWINCWQGCFTSRAGHLFRNGLGFITNDFQRNVMPEKYKKTSVKSSP